MKITNSNQILNIVELDKFRTDIGRSQRVKLRKTRTGIFEISLYGANCDYSIYWKDTAALEIFVEIVGNLDPGTYSRKGNKFVSLNESLKEHE